MRGAHFLTACILTIFLAAGPVRADGTYTITPSQKENLQTYVANSPDFQQKISEIRRLNAELSRLNKEIAVLNHGIRQAERTRDPALRKAVYNYLNSRNLGSAPAANSEHQLEDILQISQTLLQTGNTQQAFRDLGATPTADDMSAILIFAALQHVATGEKLTLDGLNTLFENSLPEEWQPVVHDFRQKYPGPRPDALPPKYDPGPITLD